MQKVFGATAAAVAGLVAMFASGGAGPVTTALEIHRPSGPVAATSATGVFHWGTLEGDRRTTVGSPTPGPGLPGPVKAIATTNSTEYALLTDGSVWAWGAGDKGLRGVGRLVRRQATLGAGAISKYRQSRHRGHR